MKLPVDKRVKVVDCTIYQRYGIVTDPLITLYSKHFTGFPVAFIGNRKVDGANSQIESEELYNSILEEDFIVQEYNDKKFNKECEIYGRGIFKRRVICKD